MTNEDDDKRDNITYWWCAWDLDVHNKQEGRVPQRKHGIDATTDRRAAAHVVVAIPVLTHIHSEGLETQQAAERGTRMNLAIVLEICSTAHRKTAIRTCNV